MRINDRVSKIQDILSEASTERYSDRSISSKFLIKFISVCLLSIFAVFIFGNNDMLEIRRESNLAYRRQVYEQIKSFVENNPNFTRLDEQYMKLAELSTDLYINEYEVPLSYYRKVLDINPVFPAKDIVLYNIGLYSSELAKQTRANRRREYLVRQIAQRQVASVIRWDDDMRLTEDKFKESIDAYREILLDFPESYYYSESIYRLAIIYFEIGIDAEEPILYYNRANDLFNQLAEREDDRFQHLGLYQRAWTFYSTNQFENAIRDFSKILNVIEEQTLYRAYFEQDAIDNIAWSLNNLDEGEYLAEAKSAVFAEENLQELIKNDNYIVDVIDKTAGIKLELNAPLQALDYYSLYLELFPLHINNPFIEDSITTIYRVYSFHLPPEKDLTELVIEKRERLVIRYDANSEWFKANSGENIDKQVEIIRNAYHFLDPIYWNRFIREESDDKLLYYTEFVNRYYDYPAFSDSTDYLWVKERLKNVLSGYLFLAEERDTPEANYHAWKQIAIFNERYPDNEEFVKNEADRYYVFDRFYRMITADGIVDTVYTLEGSGITYTVDELDDVFLYETERYLNLYAADHYTQEIEEDIVRALYSRSQIHMRRDQQEEAEQDLIYILNYNVPETLKRDIYIHLAQINESLNNYALSENYYRNATEFASDDQDRNAIRNNYLSQIEKQADSFIADSSYVRAAEEYLRLAQEFEGTDQERSVGYINEAIETFIEAGEYRRSIDLLMTLADMFPEAERSFVAYYSAWGIADTLMFDEQMVLNLQNEFISKYPSSNQAYQTRNQIILNLIDNKNAKYEASQEFLELHDDAVAGRIDIGDDKTEDIYFNALNLLADYPDEDYFSSLMLNFEKLYPNDPRAMDLLEVVWGKYDDRNMIEERDALARYIFIKDPNSQLYQNVARRELGKIYNEAVQLFNDEMFEEMLVKISEFESVYNRYTQENLVLSFDTVFEEFDDMKYYHNELLRYDRVVAGFRSDLDRIENEFINRNAGDIFRVNELTRWQEHIEVRLPNLITQADNQATAINRVLENIVAYEQESGRIIPINVKTRCIYLQGKTYEHAISIVDTQLNTFIRVSRQMNEIRNVDRQTHDNFVDGTIKPLIEVYTNHFKSYSVHFYNDLSSLSNATNHTDQHVDYALDRLSEWGYLIESLSLYSNTDWLALRTNQIIDNIDLFDWDSVTIATSYPSRETIVGMENTKALPIWVESLEEEEEDESTETGYTYYLKRVVIEGEVVDASLRFAAYDKSSVWINGRQVQTDMSVYIDEEDATSYAQTVIIDATHFVEGENIILVRTEDKSEQPGILFDLDLKISK